MFERAPGDAGTHGFRQEPRGQCRRRRRGIRLAGLLGLVAAAVAAHPAAALAVERSATPSTFASVFAAAAAGDTILLASGDYGTFTGALKSGEITITEQDGASASMAVNFNPASNLTLDGLDIKGADIADSRTKNITIRNSTFDGHSVIMRGDSLVDANVLLDRNRHVNRDVCSGCYDGRITIPGRTSEPTGITIQNSYFAGGSMDGILNGGNGVRILNNEFTDLGQNVSGDVAHTDAIQLYGSYGTVIRANYFHGDRATGKMVAVGVMCADECDREVIEDNVFAVHGSPYALQLLSDNGSRVVHNTFVDYGTCDYGLRCGVIYLGNKDLDPPSQGTVLKDNIITRACLCSGSAWGLAEESHNLYTEATLSGTGDTLASPSYEGGVSPSSYTGFRLAAGSPGTGTASDGLDRGVRFGEMTQPPPPPPPPAEEPPAPVADLVASYGFDETSPKTVEDASGNANDGTISGASRTRHGKLGRALSFDGVNDYVTIPDAASLDLTTGMTLEAWVYPTAGGSGWRQALVKEASRGVAYGLYAFDEAGRPAGSASVGGDMRARGTAALPLSTWSHVATTYDGMQLRLYVDGMLVGQRALSGPMATSAGALTIGGNAVWGEFFKGRIDNVRVFDAALTSDELKTNMSSAG